MWNLIYTQSLLSDVKSEITAVCDYIKEVDYCVDITAAVEKRRALLNQKAKLITILESMHNTLKCNDMDAYICRKVTTLSLIKEYQLLTNTNA